MTPEEARQLLEGTTPGPWGFDTQTYEEPCYPELVVDFQVTTHNGNQVAEQTDFDSDAYESGRNFNLMAAAPDMAAMIAGMTAEYAIQGKASNSDEWITLSQWTEELPPPGLETEITLTDEDTGETHRIDARIAVRYVTAPQPLEGEEQ
ncbi:hypothetical protein [Corynebacterium sp. 239_CJEI]|uniref:hypothetical protein n=1 Tax=Corynebacterium sp. 239_CJEI TaxID=2715674 RepID=UPI000667C150|nr:hypothetical protein [Corynebacterium sp. 239_CJEI]